MGNAFQSRRDYGAKAATYLTVLGWVNLVGLNLGGLVWLWMASKIRERSNGFRKGAIALLGLHVLLSGGVLPLLFLDRGQPPTLNLFGHAMLVVHPGVIMLMASTLVGVFSIPMFWLLAPETRAAFERRKERGLCVSCGYDLRETTGVCPECGTAVPSNHWTVSDVVDGLEHVR